MKLNRALVLAMSAGVAAAGGAQAQVAVVSGLPGAFIPGIDDPEHFIAGSRGDDVTVSVTIPAQFGNIILPAGAHWVDSNGRFTTDSLTNYVNVPLSTGSPAGYYPHWDDLYTDDYVESGIYAADVGDMFVVQWNADPLDWEESGYPAGYPTSNAKIQLQIPRTGGGTTLARYVFQGMGTMSGQSATIGAVTSSGVPFEYSFNTSGSVGDTVVLSVITATTGACCRADGTCFGTTSEACLAQGGTYRGDNTTCAAPCPLPPGTYAYTGGTVAIPDGFGENGCGGTAVAEIVVPDSFTVTDVNAGVKIPHEWQGDAQFRLVHGATTVTLVQRPGAAQDPPYGFPEENFGSSTGFMRFNAAGTQVYDAPPLFSGIFDVTGDWLPVNGSMTAFIGQNAQGVWRLEAEDCAGDFFGSIGAFQIVLGGGGPTCYPNCDASTSPPVLNVQDFTCFLQRYAGGDSYANCDASTAAPVLNVQDFTCFLQRYAAGCP
jgi:subtilisin-like proprotein convertase family protein